MIAFKIVLDKNHNSKFITKQYICLYFKLKMDKNTQEFYDRLKVELDLSNTWPATYLFKFIVPSEK
jgi:hypothetical protein